MCMCIVHQHYIMLAVNNTELLPMYLHPVIIISDIIPVFGCWWMCLLFQYM